MQENTPRSANLFTILTSLLLVAGCSSARPTAAEFPLRGVPLTIACPDGSDAFLRGPINAWRTRHHTGPVTFVSFAPETPADVWIVPAWQVPRWVAEGTVRPLPDQLIQRDGASPWPGVLPLYRDDLVVWLAADKLTRVPFAVPVLGEAPVLCYRTDLYDDPKHKQAYRGETGKDLSPPQTWADFVLQATYFARKANHPLPPLPADPVSVEQLFGQVASGYVRKAVEGGTARLTTNAVALMQDLETGEPRLTQRGFLHALQILQKLQACRAPAAARPPEEFFLNGTSPLCLCQTPWVARFQESAGSKVRDRFAVLPVPGAEKIFGASEQFDEEVNSPNRIPYLGGSSLVACLPRDGTHPEAAASLLAHLLERDVSNALVLSPPNAGRVVRGEQLDVRMRWDVLGLEKDRTASAKDAVRTALDSGLKNPGLALRLPDAEAHRVILVTELLRALSGTDARVALEAAARGWQARREKLGPEVIRASVRLSVGLLP